MTYYTVGRSYEYKIMNEYRNLGYYVIRSAGSHGLFDLVAFNENEIIFICCRKGRKWKESDLNAIKNSVKIPSNARILLCEKTNDGERKHIIYKPL
jgi:Holliday junction resolvase